SYNPETLPLVFQDVPGVIQVVVTDAEVVLNVSDASEALPGVVTAGNKAGIRIRSVDIEEPNLEAVFLHLTGRALRD
ncbi:MAG: hypothetical protein KAJ53_12310, partial [Anaerolineales bacterium]|nr:hypothetical protein [Anaerolineales bacterium]